MLKTKTFCWQGFCLDVPQDWRFTAESGDTKSGYLRLEGEFSWFELKWGQIEKKTASLQKIADKFIKKMEKSKKVKTFRGTAQVFRHRAVSVHLKSEKEEYAFFWFCDESNRALMGKFTFERKVGDARAVIKQVLESLKCHGLRRNIWSFLGVRFKTPVSFNLEKRKLTLRKSSLAFVERKLSPFTEQTAEILFEFFCMANVRFEDTYTKPRKWIDEYYFGQLKKRYRGLKLKASKSIRLGDHPVAVETGGFSSGLTWRKKALFIVASWHCPEVNRMYAVTVSRQVSRPAVLRRTVDAKALRRFLRGFLSSVECH